MLYTVKDQAGRYVGTLSEIDAKETMIRSAIAAMVGGTRAATIRRASVSRYTDGGLTVAPRTKRGKPIVNRQGNLVFYFVFPQPPLSWTNVDV